MNDLSFDTGVISSYETRQRAVPTGLLIRAAIGIALVCYFLFSGSWTGSLLGNALFALAALGLAAIGCLQAASMAWRLELTAQSLRWRSAFRSGQVPLAELRSIRPSSWSSRRSPVAVIEFTGRRPIRIAVRDGLTLFAADVMQAAPQVKMGLPEPDGYRWDRPR